MSSDDMHPVGRQSPLDGDRFWRKVPLFGLRASLPTTEQGDREVTVDPDTFGSPVVYFYHWKTRYWRWCRRRGCYQRAQGRPSREGQFQLRYVVVFFLSPI